MPIAIDIDQDLLARAREATGVEDTRELLNEGLRRLIRTVKQGHIRELRGKVSWEGNLDELRRGRFLDDPD